MLIRIFLRLKKETLEGLRRMIESGRLEVIVDYLSTVIRREKLGKYKKVITGNFLNFTDFILDCLRK